MHQTLLTSAKTLPEGVLEPSGAPRGGVRMGCPDGSPGGVGPSASATPGSGRLGVAGMPMYLRARSSMPGHTSREFGCFSPYKSTVRQTCTAHVVPSPGQGLGWLAVVTAACRSATILQAFPVSQRAWCSSCDAVHAPVGTLGAAC